MSLHSLVIQLVLRNTAVLPQVMFPDSRDLQPHDPPPRVSGGRHLCFVPRSFDGDTVALPSKNGLWPSLDLIESQKTYIEKSKFLFNQFLLENIQYTLAYIRCSIKLIKKHHLAFICSLNMNACECVRPCVVWMCAFLRVSAQSVYVI